MIQGRIIHSLKVGLALTLVSLFYYFQPLYDRFGEKNAVWAIFTVIIVFEFSVGKLFYIYIYIYIWYNSFRIGTKNSICKVFLFYFFPPIGETLGKGLNRMQATLSAGALGVGVHHLATLSG